MKRTTKYIFTLIICLLAAVLPTKAQDEIQLTQAEADSVLNTVVAPYSQWGSVQLDGKLSTALLPISVSTRFYMEQEKCIRISIRAPFLGEVARIDIDNEEIQIANKRKKRYCRLPMETLRGIYPGGLTDLQSLLLARVTLLNRGTLSKRDFADVDLIPDDAGGYLLVPKDALQPEALSYGYVVDSDARVGELMIVSRYSEDMATFSYAYPGSSTLIGILAAFRGKTYELQLKFDQPRYGASPMEPFSPDGNWTETSFKETLRF